MAGEEEGTGSGQIQQRELGVQAHHIAAEELYNNSRIRGL